MDPLESSIRNDGERETTLLISLGPKLTTIDHNPIRDHHHKPGEILSGL